MAEYRLYTLVGRQGDDGDASPNLSPYVWMTELDLESVVRTCVSNDAFVMFAESLGGFA